MPTVLLKLCPPCAHFSPALLTGLPVPRSFSILQLKELGKVPTDLTPQPHIQGGARSDPCLPEAAPLTPTPPSWTLNF